MRRLIIGIVLLAMVPASALALNTNDLLAAVALPLAVAAVSDISGVPQDQLANLVSTFNRANMPIVQEVQVIRYVPVALVDTNGTPFVAFVQQQVSSGITGPALVPVITQQLQTYYPRQTVQVVAPATQTVFVDERDFAPPPVVVSRVEELRTGNPHGGPPGQIKKQLGLQTGAEVVHGVRPPAAAAVVPREDEEREHGNGRGHEKNAPMSSAAPQMQPQQPVVVAPPAAGPPGQMKQKGGGKGHGKD